MPSNTDTLSISKPILRWETLNLYEKLNYNGNETKIDLDVGVLQNNGNRFSAIVTGCSPWTIYE